MKDLEMISQIIAGAFIDETKCLINVEIWACL